MIPGGTIIFSMVFLGRVLEKWAFLGSIGWTKRDSLLPKNVVNSWWLCGGGNTANFWKKLGEISGPRLHLADKALEVP